MQCINKMKYLVGDTIIEAMFAISIFSLVAVGGISIMNRGNAVAQRALEITQVRQQIDAQAEILRFINSSYIASYDPNSPAPSSGPAGKWYDISSTVGHTVSDYAPNSLSCPDISDVSANAFVFDTKDISLHMLTSSNFNSSPLTYSQVRYAGAPIVFEKSDGLWIEAARSSASGPDSQSNISYIDFHIRACWNSIGQKAPMNIGTIVRLYEPKRP